MIIGISGCARSGKDTVANILYNIIISNDNSCRLIAYADYLKEILGKCFNLTDDELYGSNKELPLCDLPIRTKSGNVLPQYWTTRRLLQYIGTDVFRRIDPNVWVNVVKNEINSTNYDYYIITDVRFPNELNWILMSGGIHLHVIRSNKDFSDRRTHISENSLSDYCISKAYLIDNNSTLSVLRNKLLNFYTKIGEY